MRRRRGFPPSQRADRAVCPHPTQSQCQLLHGPRSGPMARHNRLYRPYSCHLLALPYQPNQHFAQIAQKPGIPRRKAKSTFRRKSRRHPAVFGYISYTNYTILILEMQGSFRLLRAKIQAARFHFLRPYFFTSVSPLNGGTDVLFLPRFSAYPQIRPMRKDQMLILPYDTSPRRSICRACSAPEVTR